MRTLFTLLLGVVTTQAQLLVSVSPPEIIGQKAVVKVEMKNNFSEKIGSARAACFLLNNQARMVGQSTKWVIGGKKDQAALASKKQASFNFVVPLNRSLVASNLTAKVNFSRLVVGGGQVADANKVVTIIEKAK